MARCSARATGEDLIVPPRQRDDTTTPGEHGCRITDPLPTRAHRRHSNTSWRRTASMTSPGAVTSSNSTEMGFGYAPVYDMERPIVEDDELPMGFRIRVKEGDLGKARAQELMEGTAWTLGAMRNFGRQSEQWGKEPHAATAPGRPSAHVHALRRASHPAYRWRRYAAPAKEHSMNHVELSALWHAMSHVPPAAESGGSKFASRRSALSPSGQSAVFSGS